MSHRFDIVYRYDGSFEGMMCCVHDSFYRRESPTAIQPEGEGQASLFEEHTVETDEQNAYRVLCAVEQKISAEAAELVRMAYLTCMPDKEMAVLRFLRLGFRMGAPVMSMLADDAVRPLIRATAQAGGEAHLYKGFVRFSDYGGLMVAVIEPKNCVLPLIADHFCARFSGEAFLICDQTHHLALMYNRGRRELTSFADFELPVASDDEMKYRALWKRFYDTIAIEGRINPRCRMSHMPKRYWPQLTELQDQPGARPTAQIGERKRLEE